MAVSHVFLWFAYFSFVRACDGMTTSYLLCVLTVCLAQKRRSGFLSNLPVNIFPYLPTDIFLLLILSFHQKLWKNALLK